MDDATLSKTEKYIDKSKKDYCSELIGRAREIYLMQNSFEKSKLGERQVIVVSADSGYGKTRLIKEFIERKAPADFNFYWGNCFLSGKSSVYEPILELFSSMIGIKPNDSSLNKEKKFEKYFSEKNILNENQIELIKDFIFLKERKAQEYDSLKFVKRENVKQKEKMILSLINLVKNISTNKPVVLIIDDLQWADESSLDFLSYFLKKCWDFNIMFIISIRSDVLSSDLKEASIINNIFESIDNLLKINLNPLSKNELQKFVNSYINIEKISKELFDKIYNSSTGIPFYIEQIINSLIDSNVITKDKSMWYVKEEIDKIELPGTIKNVLQSRIDKLPEQNKNILKYALVIGNEFSKNMLILLLNSSEVEIQKNLKKLEELNYIVFSSETENYRFISNLIWEIAYDTLLIQERNKLHLNIVDFIEKNNKVKDTKTLEKLHYHCQRSLDYSKSIYYAMLLGNSMEESFAWDDALSLYLRTVLQIEQITDLTDEIKICYFSLNFRIAQIYLNRYDPDKAKPFLNSNLKIISDTPEIVDKEYLPGFYHRVFRMYELKKENDDAEKYLIKAIDAQNELGADANPVGLTINYCSLARLNTVKKNYEKAEKYFLLAINQAMTSNNIYGIATSCGQFASFYENTGNYEKAREYALEALKYKTNDNERQMGWIIPIQTVGRVSLKLGNYDEAEKYAKDSMELAIKQNNYIGQSYALQLLSNISKEIGEIKRAIEYLKQAVELNIKIKNDNGLYFSLITLFDLQINSNENDDALASILKAIEIAKKVSNKKNIVTANIKLIDLYINQKQFENAVQKINELLKFAQDNNLQDTVELLNQKKNEVLEK